MGKKSLTKSTTKKKPAKKGGKKKTVSASAKKTTQKKPTLKTLRQKQFDAWTPERLYQPEPDASYEQNFAAPPAIEAKGKAGEKVKEILAREFDLNASKPKKAAPKKAAAKKADTKKNEKKAPKKEAPKAAAKNDKKTGKKAETKKEPAKAPKKAAPKKTVSIKDLIALKFDAWQPEKPYAPAPDTDYEKNYAAPPAFEAPDKSLLLKQFDLSIPDTPAEEKPVDHVPAPEGPSVAEPAAEAAPKSETAKTAPKKEPVPIEALLKKQFDGWTPEKPYVPTPNTDFEKNFTAPPAFEGQDKALLLKQFDLSVPDTPTEEKPVEAAPAVEEAASVEEETPSAEETPAAEEAQPEPEVVKEPVTEETAPAETAPEPAAEEKTEEPEPVAKEPAAEEKPVEETAAPQAEETPAAAPVEEKPAETEAEAAETELAEPAAVEPVAKEMPAEAIAPEKEAAKAAEAPKAVDRPKAAENTETGPETEKAASQPPEPPEPERPDWGKFYGDGNGGEPPMPPMPPTNGDSPLNPGLKLLIACLGVIFALVIAASISNMQDYFVKTTDEAVEIWRGDFSPRGTHRVVELPGAKAPENIKDIYTREEALSLAFNYYLEKADALTETKGDLVDFNAIREYLKTARSYAVTDYQEKKVVQKLNRIDFMMLMFKAEMAAEKQTQAGYEKALDYLKQAKKLELDAEQATLVENRLNAFRAAKDALKVEEKIVAPPEAKPTPEAEEKAATETSEEAASDSDEAVEPEADESAVPEQSEIEEKTAGDQTGFIQKPGTEQTEESKEIAEPEGTAAPSEPRNDASAEDEKPAAADAHHH